MSHVLRPPQVGHILHTLGWSLGDYVRGYMLQVRYRRPLMKKECREQGRKMEDGRLKPVKGEELNTSRPMSGGRIALRVLEGFLQNSAGLTRRSDVFPAQHPGGKPLDRWLTAPPEEELLILQQFLRFGETRPIVELMTPQCLAAVGHVSDLQPSSAPGGLRPDGDAVVERVAGPFGCARGDLRPVCRYEKISLADHKDTVGHFEDFPEVASLLLPLPFPNSAHLAPPIQVTRSAPSLIGRTKLL